MRKHSQNWSGVQYPLQYYEQIRTVMGTMLLHLYNIVRVERLQVTCTDFGCQFRF